VNKEFAEHYSESYQQGGFEAVSGVVPPRPLWNPNPVKPTIGKNVLVEEFARIVGDVRLGSNSNVGRRSSIRADEGSPIIVGEKANIEGRVTFHALQRSYHHPKASRCIEIGVVILRHLENQVSPSVSPSNLS